MSEAATERVRRLLEERARVLARPLATPAPADAFELLAFTLGRERYALETRYVHAVFRLADWTPLPAAAAPLLGLTGWRGEVLTLLNLSRLLGAGAGPGPGETRVIVLGGERPAFGILADAIGEVMTLDRTAVRARPEASAEQRELVVGVTRDALVLLDAERLLDRQAEPGKST